MTFMCPICQNQLFGYTWKKTKRGKNWLKHPKYGWHDCPKRKITIFPKPRTKIKKPVLTDEELRYPVMVSDGITVMNDEILYYGEDRWFSAHKLGGNFKTYTVEDIKNGLPKKDGFKVIRSFWLAGLESEHL